MGEEAGDADLRAGEPKCIDIDDEWASGVGPPSPHPAPRTPDSGPRTPHPGLRTPHEPYRPVENLNVQGFSGWPSRAVIPASSSTLTC